MRYFDYNATTPVAQPVLDAMLPFFEDRWGNPSSVYSFGHDLGEAIERARSQVASLIGAQPREIVFTGCGTESSNTALASGACHDPSKRHVIMSSVEHPANLRMGERLESEGASVSYLGVDKEGLIDLSELEANLKPDTAMVSMMWANNETGVLFPIEEVGALCRSRGILLHTDAVQAAGKVPVDVNTAKVDYLSLTGHKIYAPKGVGALYVREGVPVQSLIVGGGQEQGRRAGTQNVAFIVAMGAAAECVGIQRAEEARRLGGLRDRLENALMAATGCQRNGSTKHRLPNTANLAFEGVESEALLLLLDQAGFCASSGSACSTGSLEPSHVLTAMGIPRMMALGSVRLSLGMPTTDEDVDELIATLPRLIDRLRGHRPG